MAIAYAQSCSAAIAVVLSVEGKTKFCFMSDAMKRARLGWIAKTEQVPRGSPTARQLQSGRRTDHPVSDDVDLQDWFGCDKSCPAREEVISLRSATELLTVLYSEQLSIADDDLSDEDEEADLIERWTPRFRR
jgi:hypothetical protein